jgi:hypothetical protein
MSVHQCRRAPGPARDTGARQGRGTRILGHHSSTRITPCPRALDELRNANRRNLRNRRSDSEAVCMARRGTISPIPQIAQIRVPPFRRCRAGRGHGAVPPRRTIPPRIRVPRRSRAAHRADARRPANRSVRGASPALGSRGDQRPSSGYQVKPKFRRVRPNLVSSSMVSLKVPPGPRSVSPISSNFTAEYFRFTSSASFCEKK